MNWFIDANVEKNKIALRRFRLMKSQLRFNIFDLEKRVNERIHPGLLYAYCYWESHLRDVPYSDELLYELDNFVYKQLLYRLEVISLTKNLYDCLGPVLESAIGWTRVSSQTLVQIQNLTPEQNKDSQLSSDVSSFLEDAL